MNIKALGDRVVLIPLKKENKSNGGIYIPETNNKERPFIYEIVGVGPGKDGKEMSVKIGNKVLCGQYSGDEVKIEGVEYKIVGQDYLLAIVE
ncbi:MAG: co-chaperone GroES [Candidatus Gracilibacteria bacterium]|nr:co-chaperone GroES [Candidatus Gracilibacteria bacterium]